MKGIKIFEQDLLSKNKTVGKIAIICGGLKSENPTKIMKDVVNEYCGKENCNDYIVNSLDNPWCHVVITNIYNLEYNRIDNVDIFEQNLLVENGNVISKLAILNNVFLCNNYTKEMNKSVNKYIGNELHNQFVDISLTAPFSRIIITNINKLKLEKFNNNSARFGPYNKIKTLEEAIEIIIQKDKQIEDLKKLK